MEPETAADVLLVGAAGALGQAFGARFQRGGLSVDAYVRPARRAAAEQGFTVYELRRGRPPEALAFAPREVLTEPAHARGRAYGLVLLSVSSDAMRGSWLAELAEATSEAPVAAIGQASGDRAVLEAAVGAARAAFVVPGFLAWSAPLRDETPGPGVAFWLPPMSRRLTGGAPRAAQAAADALKRAGLNPLVRAHAAELGVRLAKITIPAIAELEAAGWQPARMRGARGLATRAALAAAGLVAPLDVRAYVERHFSKVSPQTEMMLSEWRD